MACKILGSVVAFDGISYTDKHRCRLYHTAPFQIRQRIDIQTISNGHLFGTRLFSSYEGFWNVSGKPYYTNSEHSLSCHSSGSETTQCATKTEDLTATSSDELEDAQVVGNGPLLFEQKTMHGSTSSNQGLAEAFKFMFNDAQFVNERARNDMILLSRGITRLNDRACEDVAFLGLEFLKLDARAREDTEKIDHNMRRKAACLNHIATMLKDKAHSKLKTAADRHWSNGALEADLRRADFCFRRRAMEDAYMALKFVRNIHDIMANKLQQQPKKHGPSAVNGMMGIITLEKNGKAFDLFSREVSTERITAIQEAYWSMASALSEADGIDYSDPEELELLVTTLIDLDAMDGKSSVSLLAECSCSPDVGMRQALANALAAAPSVWILGNAGMGALQRLAQDSNPAVAAAASKAIHELQQQWELEEGDNLRFMMNQLREKGVGDETDTEAGNS